MKLDTNAPCQSRSGVLSANSLFREQALCETEFVIDSIAIARLTGARYHSPVLQVTVK